jgi:hypothetical protein
MAFKYKGRGERSVQEQSQKRGSFDGYLAKDVVQFKVKDDNAIRILPGNSTWDEDIYGDHWGYPIYVHYDIGVDKSAYICASEMHKTYPKLKEFADGACPICEARLDTTDKDEADALRPNCRVLTYVIDRNDEKAGPLVWAMPQSVSADISALSKDRKTGAVLLIDDPEEGRDVFFRRTGEKKRTKYGAFELDRDDTPIHDNEKKQDTWLDFISDNPLTELLDVKDYAYLEKVLMGQQSRRESEAENEGVEDAGDKRGRSRRRGQSEEVQEETSSRSGRRRGVEADPPVEEASEEMGTTRRRARGNSDPTDASEESEDAGTRRDTREKPATTARRSSRSDSEPDPEPEPTSRRRRNAEDTGEGVSEAAKEATERLRRRAR